MEQIVISINEILGWSVGVSAIVTVAISALWAISFNRIKEGQKAEFQKQLNEQQAKFDKQLEILKAKNEKCNYISKTQFDAEFKIYQELSKYSFEMLLNISRLYPMGIDYLPEDKVEQNSVFKDRYKDAESSLIFFQNKLFQYAPFISENLYKKFDEFRIECKKQVNMYFDAKVHPDSDADVRKEYRIMEVECWKRTPELYKKHEAIILELREYLQTLKVSED